LTGRQKSAILSPGIETGGFFGRKDGFSIPEYLDPGPIHPF
jgi:hypothetical protein